MKFFRKQAAVTSSSVISHYPILAYADIFASCRHGLHRFVKLIHLLKKSLTFLKQKLVMEHFFSTRNSRIIDWAPLIKASPLIKIYDYTYYDNQTNKYHNNSLAGKTILCVGGKIQLYPEYNQIVKNFGGAFISFHGDSDDTLDNLFLLMEKTADMIICPVDCVNHEIFQTVKYYCKSTGKPCVLLDRSTISSFGMGIRALIMMVKNYRH